jgi:hypothetical protein
LMHFKKPATLAPMSGEEILLATPLGCIGKQDHSFGYKSLVRCQISEK